MLVLQTVLADCLSVYLSVWSPGQILGTRWDLTLPAPTDALTWGSSYDNDSLLCASLLPSLHDPCHFFRPCFFVLLKLASLLSEFLLFSCPLTEGREWQYDGIRGPHKEKKKNGGWI